MTKIINKENLILEVQSNFTVNKFGGEITGFHFTPEIGAQAMLSAHVTEPIHIGFYLYLIFVNVYFDWFIGDGDEEGE